MKVGNKGKENRVTQKAYLKLVAFKPDWEPKWALIEMVIGARDGSHAKRIFTFKDHNHWCKVSLSKSAEFIKQIQSRRGR